MRARRTRSLRVRAERYETAGASRGSADRRRRIATSAAGSAPTLGGQIAPALRRSIHVRHIDCGSDGSEEWEIQALWNPYYDIQRLGFFLTAAPRHADILLVTGGVTHGDAGSAGAHLGGDARAQGARRRRHRRLLGRTGRRRMAPDAGGVDRGPAGRRLRPRVPASTDRDPRRTAARRRNQPEERRCDAVFAIAMAASLARAVWSRSRFGRIAALRARRRVCAAGDRRADRRARRRPSGARARGLAGVRALCAARERAGRDLPGARRGDRRRGLARLRRAAARDAG